ncbi:MAG TPA: DUF3025 domain-containing protein [Gammaproteobacteria bacterium]
MRLNVDAQVGWHADFYLRSPLFEPLAEMAARFSGFPAWPALADYQRVLDALPEPIRLLSGKPLRIVAQDGKPHSFADHYAPRIYLSGEVQTRSANWHDFFQYLTWFIFPRAKAQINALHLPLARQRIENGESGRRTPLENMLSLFDEGGAVLAASDPSVLQLIREFRWKELFWRRRAELAEKLHCITFGHALYEKGLTPYLGMTANTILLEVPPGYFSLPLNARLEQIDGTLAALLRNGQHYRQPKDLHPFPILGMPGWERANAQEDYYDNTRYFRSGRALPVPATA